ncbi:MAG: T9SS type A sorting domain-containing protein [Bacteroidetes bacterium]|nr:MAG: T9SS type A sorting domain-containing protein [Bacteroidota bacterium]
MLKDLSVLLLLLLVGTLELTAQQRTCAANEVLQQQLEQYPQMQQLRDAIENHTNQFIQDGAATDRAVITIPVVVHVVWYTGNPAENLSQARIQSQIDVLTADFRRLNADAPNTPGAFQGVAADCEFEFCLAKRDPSGNPTDGIVRRETSVTSFGSNDNVKFFSSGGSDAWPRDQYLNIWVCDLNGLLGYAQFPGGPANTDGVVCDYLYFGTTEEGAQPPFDKGRTATHEVGHWLNCYHIWGDDRKRCTGSDLVDDTPNQADENYGCPSFPEVSCQNGPDGDMFMNYMDYTDDACMNLFTLGQKARMQSLFNPGGFREALKSSLGCVEPNGNSCGTPGSLTASNISQNGATLSWSPVNNATAYNLEWKESIASSWNSESGLNTTTFDLTGLSASTDYDFRVQADCNGTTGSYSPTASFTTLGNGGGGCTDNYEPNDSRNAAVLIPVNEAINALIGASSDNDYYTFDVPASTPNIKIDVISVPADYDLRLYRGNKQVGISQNPGTSDEQIIYNNANTSFDYYARVYGYAGAYNTSDCYTLQVSLSSSSWRKDGTTDGQVIQLEIPVDASGAGFGMWPNPASSRLTVEVPLLADANVQVTLFDASGRTALQQQRNLVRGDNRIDLELSNLQNGIYFVQVRNGEHTSMRKLVVQR